MVVLQSTAGPSFRRWPSGCTCTDRRRAERLAAEPARRADDLRPPAAVRRRACSTGHSSERRATLERLDLHGAHWQVPPAYDDGPALFAATREQGLEGVVSKRRTSTYQPGRRSPDWLKLPHRRVQSCLVGGWRPETGSEQRIGALLLGIPRAADPDPARVTRRHAGPGLRRPGRQRHQRQGRGRADRAGCGRSREPPRRSRSRWLGWTPRAADWSEPQVVVEVGYLRPDRGRPAAAADLPRRARRPRSRRRPVGVSDGHAASRSVSRSSGRRLRPEQPGQGALPRDRAPPRAR